MGWASGSEIAGDVWDLFKKHVPKDKKKKVAKKLVHIFEMHDCDTICEVQELCKLAHDHHEDDEDYE